MITIFDRFNAQRSWMEEERLVLDQVMRIAEDVIAPAAVGYDKSGDYPETSMAALNELGMNAIFVPEAYGGAGLGWVDLVVLLEETGRSLLPARGPSATRAEDEPRRLMVTLAHVARKGGLAKPGPMP